MTPELVREGTITFEEFLDTVADGQKADLLDGVIYNLNVWLCTLTSIFVETNELGKIYVSRVAYKLGKKRGPEPDLGFVPKKMEKKRKRGYIDGAPYLAVEIVSPDSVQHDVHLETSHLRKSRRSRILDPRSGRKAGDILDPGTGSIPGNARGRRRFPQQGAGRIVF